MSRTFSTGSSWDATGEDSGVRFEVDDGLRVVAMQTDYSTKFEEQVESILIHLNKDEVGKLMRFLEKHFNDV